MKLWLSATEIAALSLPNLPTTKLGVLKLATRQGWKGSLSRPRAGRGGGLEYSIDLLPPAARAAYVARHVEMIDVPAAIAREAAAAPGAALVSAGGAEARDARLAVLGLLEKFEKDAKISGKRAARHFCDCYNGDGEQLTVAEWIRKEIKTLHPRTIARWRKARRENRLSSLAVDRSRSRKGTGVLDRANGGEVKTYILALIAKQPQLTAVHIRALVADRFPALSIGGRSIAVPPVRTLQYALNRWRDEYRNELQFIRDPDGFKSKTRFAARVARPAQALNELWQIDASPADILTTDGRFNLYVGIDVYSRRLIGLVTRTPRAESVCLLVRKAIMAWGVPDRIKTDNGSDFIARETQRLFAALGIEHERSAPFSPEQKGHVERAIGTMQHGLMRTLEGFIGHSVPDRKVIEGRKAFSRRLGETPEDAFEVALSAADLQKRVDEWCDVVYAGKPHAGLEGRTPFAVAASYGGTIRKIEDVRALDMLLAKVPGKDGLRTVTKTGIRIDGTHYINGAMEVGATVLVRMDPADMGRAFVFNESGDEFVCEAIAPDLLGIDPAKAISAARAAQKQFIAENTADIRREAKKIKARDFAPAIVRQAAKDQGKLVEFPRASEAHDTPALSAAAAAFAEPEIPAFTSDVIELHKKLLAESNEPASITVLRQETPHQRWNRAREIAARVARRENVEPDDLMWLGGYREGPEYRGFALTYGTEMKDAADAAL